MAEETIRSGGNYEMSISEIGAAGYLAMYGMRETRSVAAFESSSDKDRIEKCIAHLFTTFIREPRYSI